MFSIDILSISRRLDTKNPARGRGMNMIGETR